MSAHLREAWGSLVESASNSQLVDAVLELPVDIARGLWWPQDFDLAYELGDRYVARESQYEAIRKEIATRSQAKLRQKGYGPTMRVMRSGHITPDMPVATTIDRSTANFFKGRTVEYEIDLEDVLYYVGVFTTLSYVGEEEIGVMGNKLRPVQILREAVAGITPEQLAFINRVRDECQDTYGDAMVCREVTQALHDEFGWTVESGHYAGPGHDIREVFNPPYPGHRYIRQPDGTIIDPTHDQYEPGTPLLVIPPGDPRQSWYVPIGRTAAATVEKVKDPMLGQRWVIVCDFHGVTGRWKTKAEAEAALPKHQEEGDLREGSTWRGFSGEGRTIWNEHDVVILSQRRGRERYFEVFIGGQNYRNYPRLDEAKAGVEAKVGPVTWKQEKMDRVWVEHYYFGWTPEFTDPLFVYWADLPKT